MSNEKENDFSHSMTDLMASLAIIFLILAVAMIVQNKLSENTRASKYDAMVNQNEEIRSLKKDLLGHLKEIFEITKNGSSFSTEDGCILIDGDSSPYKIKIRLNGENLNCKSRGFFYSSDSASIQINPLIEKTITSISNFYQKLCSAEIVKNIDRIQILGHTDSVMSNRDMANCIKTVGEKNSRDLQCGNINLSSARAQNVFLLLGRKISIIDFKNISCFTEKTEVSGRGPFDIESKKLNFNEQRRVEIVVNLAQPKMQ